MERRTLIKKVSDLRIETAFLKAKNGKHPKLSVLNNTS